MTSPNVSASASQAWVVWFLQEGRVYGLGIYLGDRLIVTPAHVVAGVLGVSYEVAEAPVGNVEVQFAQAKDTIWPGRVVAWVPPRSDSGGDIALIELALEAPPTSLAAPTVNTEDLGGHRCRIYGYPRGFESGIWATGEVVGPVESGLWQLAVQGVSAGFSGAPVWDDTLGGVIGMLVTYVRDQTTAFMIPATDLMRRVRAYRLGDYEQAAASGIGSAVVADERYFASDRVQWVTDSAATSDSLQRALLARVVSVRLRGIQAESPGHSFLMHVDGEWGAGKTSLLNLVRDEFKTDWQVVDFDAWKQSKLGPPWWSLLTTLRGSLKRSRHFPARVRLRVIESCVSARRGGGVYLLAILGTALLSLGIYLAFRPGFSPKSAGDLAKTVTACIAALAALWAGALVAARFLLWDSPRGARIYENSNTNPMESIADHFSWLIKAADRPVLFLIDDLDRAPAGYVVELLEAIQTLVRDASQRGSIRRSLFDGCHFIVAADGAWIRQSFESIYADFAVSIAEPGRPLGYLFLDKIFQLTVYVPPMSLEGQGRYLRQLLDVGVVLQSSELDLEREALDQRIRTSSSEAEIIDILRSASPAVSEALTSVAIESLLSPEVQSTGEHFLEQFSHLLRPNPRSMKRYIVAYSLARTILTIQGEFVPGAPLALWLIVRTRWPSLADFLQAHPELLDLFAMPQDKSSVANLVPQPLLSLIANEDVRRVLTYRVGGPLTPD